MHPKALLDACAELVGRVLKFEHPADAVVSRYFREHRALGPRERATLAETENRLRSREDAVRQREEAVKQRLDRRLDEQLRDARR